MIDKLILAMLVLGTYASSIFVNDYFGIAVSIGTLAGGWGYWFLREMDFGNEGQL